MIDLASLYKHRHVDHELKFTGDFGHPNAGVFVFQSPIDKKWLRCIVSKEYGGWDHVSVSRADKCPTWEEMCFIKNKFFHPEEAVMQYHPPESEWVNNHQYCLHLWKCLTIEIPKPPSHFVGFRELNK